MSCNKQQTTSSQQPTPIKHREPPLNKQQAETTHYTPTNTKQARLTNKQSTHTKQHT